MIAAICALFAIVLTIAPYAEAECAWALWVNPAFAPEGHGR